MSAVPLRGRMRGLDGPDRHCTVHELSGRYLAFPDIVTAPDGRLIAAYRDGAAHISSETRLWVAESANGGRSWSNHRVLDERTIGRDGFVWAAPRFTRLSDGSLVLVCDAVLDIDWQTQRATNPFVLYLWRSFDGGQTWGQPRPLFPGFVPDRVVELADGTWLLGAQLYDNEQRLYQFCRRSADGGQTWGPPTDVARASGFDFCEGSTVRLSGDHLLTFVRENAFGGPSTFWTKSMDAGLTWSPPRPTPVSAQRAVIGQLASGRLLSTYRNIGDADSRPVANAIGRRIARGVVVAAADVRTSTCAWLGRSPSARGRLLELDHDESGMLVDYGYSGWVQLGDATIVCVYYHRGSRTTPVIKACRFTEGDFGAPRGR